MKKTVLITGCSSGIGKTTAIHFSSLGYQVAATMRNPEDAADLKTIDGLAVFALDVTDEQSIRNTVAAVIEKFGQIDVLVNNAGFGLFGPFEPASPEKIEKVFRTNVYGVMNMIRAVLPHFRERRSGVIVNVTSIGGLVGLPLNSIYHATKFAVDGFSESLFYELEPFGIHVKVVAPGGVATDFAGRSLNLTFDNNENAYAPFTAKVMDAFASRRGNYSKPEAVAEVIATAAADSSPKLRYLSGEDAERLLAGRRNADDATFYNIVKTNFNA